MGISPTVPSVKKDDWQSVIVFNRFMQKYFGKLTSTQLGAGASPTFLGVTITGLSANRLVYSDGSKELQSVSNLASWIAGTANEIDIADDGDGTITVGIVNPLIVGKGGTGASTLTDHGLLLGSGTGAITALNAATNGQLPIGSTGADPVLATITGTANQITVTNGAGTITLSTPQDIATTSSVEFGALLVDQDSDAVGLEIDSEATTYTNYGLKCITGQGAGCAYFSLGDSSNGCFYCGLPNNESYAGTFLFVRNLAAASTDSPLVYIWQDNDSDDQACLELQQDGSGKALIANGDISCTGEMGITGGVTISTNIVIPDDGYIGSVSDNDAIQIDASGNVTFSQIIYAESDISCKGNLIFTVDNSGVGYSDNSPMLVFNNTNDRTEVTGDLNIANLTASRLVASDASKNLVSSDLASWVTGTANQISVTDDADGTITLALTGNMDELSALAVTDGNFVVGNGSTWVAESGNTARTSLGLGTGDSVQFDNLTLESDSTGIALYITKPPANASPYVQVCLEGDSGETNKGSALCFISKFDSTEQTWYVGSGTGGVEDNNNFRLVDLTDSIADVFNIEVGAGENKLWINSSGAGFGTNNPQEDVHANDTVRADTAFNLNGTDIITSGTGIADIDGLTPTDSNFIVGNGANWVAENGNTARTSLGLGTGDSPTFAGLTVSGLSTFSEQVTSSYTTTTTGKSAFKGELTVSTASGDVALGYGITGRVRVSGGNNITNNVVGLFGLAQHNGTGTIALARGLIGQIQCTAAGTITEARSLEATYPYRTAGTIALLYGLYIDEQKKTGVTTAYGVYQTGANDTNYFAANAGFGTNNPQEDVHANDTVRADTAFNLNGTDGVSGTYDVYNDGTVGNVTQFTVSGGIITSVTVAT